MGKQERPDMKRSELVHQYLTTLGLQDRTHDFAFLSDLAARHLATFAFSSVGCLLGDDLPLDFESLFDRIVTRRRGGYCFEQNGLFFEVLEELGFSPRLVLARVIFNQDNEPGLTHRNSIVEYEGQSYVLDVGFGPHGPRVPVPMSGTETKDGHQVFRVSERRPGEHHLQVLKDGDFAPLYRFELARYVQADCEVGHFYSHRHPSANFVNHLVVSLIKQTETLCLRDREYSVTTEAGIHKQDVGNPRQLHGILVKELGIQVTPEESHRLYEEGEGKPT